jgi:hypothetical protein
MADYTDDIHAAITLTTGAQAITTGITAPNVARCLSVTGTKAGNTLTGDVVLTGTDENGTATSETIALNGNATVFGVQPFKTVTQIDVPVRVTASDTVKVGVADRLFDLPSARAFTLRSDRPLQVATTFTDDDLLAIEAVVRDIFEHAIGRALLPTVSTCTLDGNAGNLLRLPVANPAKEQPRRALTVTAASIDGSALDATALAALVCHPDGRVVRTDGNSWSSSTGYQDGAVSVTVIHGWSAVPARTKRAALRLAVHYLVGSDVPDGAVSFSDGNASYQFARPGQAPHWTGLDDVDAELLALSETRVVVA